MPPHSAPDIQVQQSCSLAPHCDRCSKCHLLPAHIRLHSSLPISHSRAMQPTSRSKTFPPAIQSQSQLHPHPPSSIAATTTHTHTHTQPRHVVFCVDLFFCSSVRNRKHSQRRRRVVVTSCRRHNTTARTTVHSRGLR